MDYYIQGGPARDDEIKEAFEARGIDTTAFSFDDEDWLYFSSNGLLHFEEFSNTLLNIFKTHPGYTELPLPVKHKFKVHDWVVDGDRVAIIYDLQKNGYVGHDVNRRDFVCRYSDESRLHLWSIADAKDGDVLACGDWLFILKQFNVKGNNHKTYCHYDLTLNRFKDDTDSYMVSGSDEFHPANNEERGLLFAKMREAGYEWDAEKKELRKIKPHYDIANFHAGMPVLVRDSHTECWTYLLFSNIEKNGQDQFIAGAAAWKQCIPFEGNEHLLGTTDMPDEMYINW